MTMKHMDGLKGKSKKRHAKGHQFPFEEKPAKIPEGKVWCDDRREIIPARECWIKHKSAGMRKQRDERQGKPTGYLPCLACPEGIAQDALRTTSEPAGQDDEPAQQQKKKEKPMGTYIKGVCKTCKREASIFRKCGECQVCVRARTDAGRAAAKAAKQPRAVISQKPKPTPKPGRDPVEGPPPGLTITIPPEFCAELSSMAIEELRTPENQAVWIIRQYLRAERIVRDQEA